MAKFNEKALCLFYKTYDQLEKEAERRGMRHEGREKTIAKIIWKDAYDAGVNEGRDARQVCPIATPPQVEDYCLYDFDVDKRYRLKLTKEQVRMIEWLQDMEFIQDIELTPWEEQGYENIGTI